MAARKQGGWTLRDVRHKDAGLRWARCLLILWCAWSRSTGTIASEVGEFDTPAIAPLRAAELAVLRARVAEHPEALADRVRIELDRARAVADDPPRPVSEIHYEGLVHNDPRRIATVARLNQMRDMAWLLRGWQLTDEPKWSQTLRDWTVAWAQTYRVTGNEVNEAKLLPVIIAYESLRETFSPPQRDRIDAWVRALGEHHVRRTMESEHLTNRYAKHLAIACHAARVLGRDDWLAEVRRGIQRMIEDGLEPDGASRDLRERDSLTYHASGLRVLTELSLLLDGAGAGTLYDWESSRGASIRRSIDFMMPYVRGEQTRAEWRNTSVQLDRDRAAAGLEAYRPDRLYEPRSAIELLELASAYDASLRPVVEGLIATEGSAVPSWRLLLNDAIFAH